ncbi:hypothetical protein FQA39_LY14340 [Lamprigera yunnana]|nr:hypothetical protein FQA39_LY14340 [Lamprigera yunnana]
MESHDNSEDTSARLSRTRLFRKKQDVLLFFNSHRESKKEQTTKTPATKKGLKGTDVEKEQLEYEHELTSGEEHTQGESDSNPSDSGGESSDMEQNRKEIAKEQKEKWMITQTKPSTTTKKVPKGTGNEEEQFKRKRKTRRKGSKKLTPEPEPEAEPGIGETTIGRVTRSKGRKLSISKEPNDGESDTGQPEPEAAELRYEIGKGKELPTTSATETTTIEEEANGEENHESERREQQEGPPEHQDYPESKDWTAFIRLSEATVHAVTTLGAVNL